jgi:transcriptional regulator with XRE-family HTH domain
MASLLEGESRVKVAGEIALPVTDREIYMVVMGRVLWSVRKHARLSQVQQCTLASVTQSSLSRFELGITLPDLFELRGFATDLTRLVRIVEEVFAETRESMKTMRAVYSRDELAAVVMLVIGGYRARLPNWLEGL